MGDAAETQSTGVNADPVGADPGHDGAGPGGARARMLAYVALFLTVFSWVAASPRAAGLQMYRVAGASMSPTIAPGTEFVLDSEAYSIETPKRGDIVLFRATTHRGQVLARRSNPAGAPTLVVKRVIGVPGDLIEFAGPQMFINGVPIQRASTGEEFVDPSGLRSLVYSERLGSETYRVLEPPDLHEHHFLPIRVPEGRYFVIGDHRENSQDSRSFGSVDAADILGRVSVPPG